MSLIASKTVLYILLAAMAFVLLGIVIYTKNLPDKMLWSDCNCKTGDNCNEVECQSKCGDKCCTWNDDRCACNGQCNRWVPALGKYLS